jgi:hypothetical protein
MKALFILLLTAGSAFAVLPTGTVTRAVITDTNSVLFGSSTNLPGVNGLALLQGYPATTNYSLVAGDGCTLVGQVATLPLSGRVSVVSSEPLSSFSFTSDASTIGASLDVEYWHGSGWTNELIYPCYTGSVYYAAGGPDGSTARTLSNWVVNGYGYLPNVGKSNDMRGIPVIVDTPAVPGQAAPKSYVDAQVGAVTPINWANYPAVNNLQMNGHLILNNGWGLTQTSGVGIISYGDVWASTNEMTIAHNGTPVITLASGYSGLTITNFSIIGATNAYLYVSTNGVVSAPVIETTTDLVLPKWQPVTPDYTSYPTVTNYAAYLYQFAVSSGGYYRAVQLSGTNTVSISGTLVIDGTNATWQTMQVLALDGSTNTIRYLGAP